MFVYYKTVVSCYIDFMALNTKIKSTNTICLVWKVNLFSFLSVQDEGYSRSVSCALTLDIYKFIYSRANVCLFSYIHLYVWIKTILVDVGYLEVV